MDDVPTAQPALALTQKVYQRVVAAGVPVDLLPEDMVELGVAQGGDAENALRTATLEFMDTVRKVEASVAASRRGPDTPAELDVSTLGDISEDEWRSHWPTFVEEAVEEAESEGQEPESDEAQVEGELEESDAEVDAEPDEGDEADEPDEGEADEGVESPN
jgi:XTP/dITP diphosphohydrolase